MADTDARTASTDALASPCPPFGETPLSMLEARRRLTSDFLRSGSESAALDARILVEAAAGGVICNHDPFAVLEEAVIARIAGFRVRRIAGEPVWRILGEREFWGLPFSLSNATLEPRPDSESIIEAALETLSGRRNDALSILDLGTGSGCLLIALLSEFRSARGLGVDVAPEACETAMSNAVRNGVAERAQFRVGDWVSGVSGVFDLIVSNPPYIATAELESLPVAVRDHDPTLALDGGADGLAAYRVLAAALPGLLGAAGVAILEIGAGQAREVVAIMQAGGLRHRGERHDLGGHPRAQIFGRT